jgi:hypothetical protein
VTATKDWDRAHQATKAKYRRGGRSKAEARRLYESGEPPPPARPTKTERKKALAIRPPTAPAEVDQLWADRINEADQQMRSAMEAMVGRIVALGKTLRDAKDELGHGNFIAMVENKTRLGIRAAEQYMQIAEHEVLANPNQWFALPPYVGTLRVLATWKPKAVEAAITKGDVTPDIDRTKANELSREYGPPKAIPARPATTTPTPGPPIPKPQPRGSGAKSPLTVQQQDPDQDQEDDRLVRMVNGSGRVRIGTRFQSGRVAIGTEKGWEPLLAVMAAARSPMSMTSTASKQGTGFSGSRMDRRLLLTP